MKFSERGSIDFPRKLRVSFSAEFSSIKAESGSDSSLLPAPFPIASLAPRYSGSNNATWQIVPLFPGAVMRCSGLPDNGV